MKIHPLLAITLLIPVFCQAASHVGTVTRVEGTAMLFTHPSPQAEGPSPRVLMDGIYYTSKALKIGDQMDNGNVVQARPGSKAMIVYDNGDQMMVGSGSFYKISWANDPQQTAPLMDLKHGKIRAILEKNGPRRGFRLKTRSATMGVRGTDFFVTDNGTGTATEISVMRGEVAVEAAQTTAQPAAQAAPVVGTAKMAAVPSVAKPLIVSKGQSASVLSSDVLEKIQKATPETKTTPISQVNVFKTSKSELEKIKISSMVKQEIQKEVAASEETAKKTHELEQKAMQTTLKDLAQDDKKLMVSIEKSPPKTVDEINNLQVEKEIKTAPVKSQNPVQLRITNLKDVEQDVYRKYFKDN